MPCLHRLRNQMFLDVTKANVAHGHIPLDQFAISADQFSGTAACKIADTGLTQGESIWRASGDAYGNPLNIDDLVSRGGLEPPTR